MRAALAIAAVLFAVPACKKKAAKPKAALDAAIAAEQAPPDAEEPTLAPEDGVTADGLRAILPPKIGLPGPFVAVPLRTGPLPQVLDDAIDNDGWWRDDKFPGAAVEAKVADDVVWAIAIALPRDARDVIAEKWGPPTPGNAFVGEGETDERPAWFDPEARLRAWIVADPMFGPELVIERYTPTLAALDQLRGMAKLLGKPLDDREHVAGTHWNPALDVAEVPPFDWDGFGVGITTSGFTFQGDDTITSISTRLYYGSREHEQQLTAAIIAAWGPAQTDGERTVHGTGPFLDVTHNVESNSLDLELTATDPRSSAN